MVNLTAMAKAYPDKNLIQIVNSQEMASKSIVYFSLEI